MFDDVHPGIVAGLVGAFISIILTKILHGISVFRKRQQLKDSVKALDKGLRPVLMRMAKYDADIPWTKELEDAMKINESSWYNVFNLLKLNEIINSPTSGIYTTMKVAQLVAAEAASAAAESRVHKELKWVSVKRGGRWDWEYVHVSPPRPPTPTSLPDYPSEPPDVERELSGMEWAWVAVPRSRKWEWQWTRVLGRNGAGLGLSHIAIERTTHADPEALQERMYLSPGHHGRRKKEKKQEKSRKGETNRDKERCQEEEMPHHQHHREEEEARKEENEEKMAAYEKKCKNLLSSSEDPLHTMSSSHQEEIHPEGLPPLSLSHSQSRRRRRGGGNGEYGHGNEADASAHPHFP